VGRLLPPESMAAEVVSRVVGVNLATLERWRADALATGAAARRGGGGQRWTPAARRRQSLPRRRWMKPLAAPGAESTDWILRSPMAGNRMPLRLAETSLCRGRPRCPHAATLEGR
jgi:hypothetical protein